MTRLITLIFDYAHPNIFNPLLICVNLYQHSKNRCHTFCSFLRYSRVPRPDWPHLFLTMSNQNIFDQLLIFMNIYQHAKNEVVSSICSGEIFDLKILKSDWLRAFWFISQEQDLCRNSEN